MPVVKELFKFHIYLFKFEIRNRETYLCAFFFHHGVTCTMHVGTCLEKITISEKLATLLYISQVLPTTQSKPGVLNSAVIARITGPIVAGVGALEFHNI